MNGGRNPQSQLSVERRLMAHGGRSPRQLRCIFAVRQDPQGRTGAALVVSARPRAGRDQKRLARLEKFRHWMETRRVETLIMSGNSLWPDLPLAAWSDTCETLHRWTQIAGKVRLASTPLINHWWNVTLHVNSRGLVAPANLCAGRTFDIVFDLVDHQLRIATSDGRTESFALAPMSVADFYAELMPRLRRLDIDVHIWTMPSEIENAEPFDRDRTHAQYDPDYASRFRLALIQAARVMNEFRARFIGKASPVHFFWGSFDLAVTRFSGRTAPPPKGVTPNVAGWVMAEAYSHEVSSCGFWPGNGGYGRAAFYVYAYPEPAGYGETRLRTAEAFYDNNLGQFILPYDAVREARDPDALLLGFLQETYEAAAAQAKWDRKALERGD